MKYRAVHLFSLCTLTVFFLFSAAFLCLGQTAFAEGESSVSVTASADTVHSGGRFTLTVQLASPAASDMHFEIAGGKEPSMLDIPAGETSASKEITAGQYDKKTAETYTLSQNGANAATLTVNVLPKPKLSFHGSYYTVTAGSKFTANMRCANASEMTVPLPVSLRLADGTVVETFEIDAKTTKFTCRVNVPKDWEVPYYICLFNDITNTQCAEIPVKVLDPNRTKGIYRVDTEEKKIAISFDCGFENQFTQYILDTLDEYGIKTTFFVTGEFVTKYPDMLAEIHKRGHEIGNHTLHHNSLPKLTEDKVYEEVKGVNDAVFQITGTRPVIMRPPYGSGNYKVHTVVRMAGCEVIYWTIDSVDWDPKRTKEEIISRSTSKLKNGSIILFHNSAPKTEETLRTILDSYKEQGFQIVPVSDLLYHKYYTINKMGEQQLNPDYQAVSPSDLLGNYPLSVNVTGAGAEGEPSAVLHLKPVFTGKTQYRPVADVQKIKADPNLLEVRLSCGDTIAAPVTAGDTIGTATFSYQNEVWFTADLTALSDIAAAQPAPPADNTPSETAPQLVSPTEPPTLQPASDNRLSYIVDGVILVLLAAGAVLLTLLRKRSKAS